MNRWIWSLVGGEMHVALREGHADAGFRETLLDHQPEVAGDDHGVRLVAELDPEVDPEDQGVVAEVLEDGEGRRLLQNQAVAFGALGEDLA